MTGLLERAGAVAAEGRDTGVAAHYGDPFAEQRALAERVGLVDRSHRGVIAVPGADRLSWLHSLTSQHLTDLKPWRGTEALILSPNGHVEHHMRVADDGTTTWLDVEPGTATELLTYLDSMRFMLRVDPTDASADWALLSLIGPDSPGTVTALGAETPAEPNEVKPLPDGGWVRRVSWPNTIAYDLLVPRESVETVSQKLIDAGARPAGSWAYEALRVAALMPRLGFETDHRTIAQEPNWVPSAVHLNKGCYRGQEAVARVHNLGRPPRKMVLLHLDGMSEDVPEPGAPVLSGERQIGFVGTAVQHFELGQIALAIVRRNVAADAQLTVAGCAAGIDPDSLPADEDRPRVGPARGEYLKHR